jgi:hypothetical protein
MQPSPPLRSGPDQIIWVTSVTPEPDLSQRMFADGVNENVQQYHRYNDIKTFSTLRPYKVLSSSSGGTEEGAGVMTWLEKTVLTCLSPSVSMDKADPTGKDTFPAVLARSEVVEVKYEHLSPINAANNSVKEATRSLKSHVTPPHRKLECVIFGPPSRNRTDHLVSNISAQLSTGLSTRRSKAASSSIDRLFSMRHTRLSILSRGTRSRHFEHRYLIM